MPEPHPDLRGALYVLRASFDYPGMNPEMWEESLHLLLDRPTDLCLRMAREVGEEANGAAK